MAGDTTLHKLPRILQIVMGWEDYHLYEFTIEGRHFGNPHLLSDYNMENAQNGRLSQVIRGEKMKFVYQYDFGDDWKHEIVVEKVIPPEAGVRYPVCLAGKRACPPEDCGGIYGYADLLEIVQNPKHERYEEMMRWLGEEFDPETFSLEEVNRQLRRVGGERRKM